MRRVVRPFFTILSAISLLLCLALCGVWVRSYFVRDEIALTRGYPEVEILSSAGAVGFHEGHETDPKTFLAPGEYGDPVPRADPRNYANSGGTVYGFAGFAIVTHRMGSFRDRMLVVPTWAMVALSAIAPIVSGRRMVRARRLRRLGSTCCIACGYDLRSHATGERCPECATVIQAEG